MAHRESKDAQELTEAMDNRAVRDRVEQMELMALRETKEGKEGRALTLKEVRVPLDCRGLQELAAAVQEKENRAPKAPLEFKDPQVLLEIVETGAFRDRWVPQAALEKAEAVDKDFKENAAHRVDKERVEKMGKHQCSE